MNSQLGAWLATVVLAAMATSCARTPSGDRLNVIIVMVDTLRRDHLHCYGYPRKTSPHIDDFAKSAAVFTNHYSTASRTGPAVASMITGLFPRSHGVVNPLTHWDAKGILGDEQITLAEILRGEGYASYGYVTNLNVSRRFGFAQGFDEYHFIESKDARSVNDAAISRLLDRSKRPFFLYLHYMEPHSPYRSPAPYQSLFIDSSYRGPINGEHGQLDRIVSGELEIGSDDVRQLEALYDQEIRGFDDEFQRLLESLGEHGLLDDTLIVFVGDHGEEFLDHGSVLHGYTLYEEQLRVPLIIRDPRRTEPRRIESTTRHTDITPTILDLLGVTHPTGEQGQSLVPLLDGEPSNPWRPSVYAEASLMAVKTIRKRSFMVEGWKLIETEVPTPRTELYDLDNDPREQRDLSTENPEKVAELTHEMNRFVMALPVAASQTVRLRQAEIEALRSLGYVK